MRGQTDTPEPKLYGLSKEKPVASLTKIDLSLAHRHYIAAIKIIGKSGTKNDDEGHLY